MRSPALLIALIAALALATPAQAADKPLTPQQQRMVDCNKAASAKGLRGEARQDFMRSCMHGDGGGRTTQQQKMTECNRQATAQGLKGDARRDFMSQCLKK